MKNNIIVLSISLFMLTIISCKKEGDIKTDGIAPEITLTITGGGFNRTFSSNETIPLGQLNMKPFTKYNYSIVISDTAGLKLSNFKLSKYTDYPYTDFEVNFSPSFVASTTTFNHVYTYTGDISDPYKSLLITGSFVTSVIQGADIPISFLIEARDYTPNRTNLAIDGNLTDSPAGGYGWVEF